MLKKLTNQSKWNESKFKKLQNNYLNTLIHFNDILKLHQ